MKFLAVYKAGSANWSAGAGQTIIGNLARDASGRFASAGSSSTPKVSPEQAAAAVAQQMAGGGGKGGKGGKKGGGGKGPKVPKAPKLTPEQRQQNAGKVQDKQLGDDSEAFGFIMDPNSGTTPNDLNPEYQKSLSDRGLIARKPDGTYAVTNAGKEYQKASESGDEVKAQAALDRAKSNAGAQQQAANQREQNRQDASDLREQQRQERDAQRQRQRQIDNSKPRPQNLKKEFRGIVLKKQVQVLGGKKIGRTLPSSWEKKELSAQMYIFKDAQGNYRWIGFSSSAYEDHDGEWVTKAALDADVARADADGNYGPLRWWHVPGLDLGTCDYNAMVGNILVESGTFYNNFIAEAFKSYDKPLGMSIGFERPWNEPINGVFTKIKRFERSVLPAGFESNPLTRFGVVTNYTETTKEMIEQKINELVTLLGGGQQAQLTVKGILAEALATEKSADEMGLIFKAMGGGIGVAKKPASAAGTPPPASPNQADASAAPEDKDNPKANAVAAATTSPARNGIGAPKPAPKIPETKAVPVPAPSGMNVHVQPSGEVHVGMGGGNDPLDQPQFDGVDGFSEQQEEDETTDMLSIEELEAVIDERLLAALAPIYSALGCSPGGEEGSSGEGEGMDMGESYMERTTKATTNALMALTAEVTKATSEITALRAENATLKQILSEKLVNTEKTVAAVNRSVSELKGETPRAFAKRRASQADETVFNEQQPVIKNAIAAQPGEDPKNGFADFVSAMFQSDINGQ